VSDVDARHRALLQTLVDHRVRFVLVGGVALQLHGYSGSTRDVDIAIATDPANRTRLGAALGALRTREYLPGPRGTAYDTRLGRLEVMNSTDGIGDYDAWVRGARRMRVAEGLTVAVGAPSDLLASKEAAGRPKDLEVLPRVRAELLAAGTLDAGDVRRPVAELEHEPPPDPATETLLGPRPRERRARALWDRGSQLLADYCRRWRLELDDRLHAPAPDTSQGRDFVALQRQLARLGRPIDRSLEGPSLGL
jgi:hypothetical protein